MKKNPILSKSISSLLLIGAISFLPQAQAGDTTWTGGGASNVWGDANNWGGTNVFTNYGTVRFTLNGGGAQGTTSVVNGNISQNGLFWSGTSSWTLNNSGGAVISLFDSGGTQAKIENQSTGLVTINAPITFAANNGSPPNPFGEINAVNGDITFGTGTLTVNGSSVNGIKLFGSNHTATFNNTVSASGKWFGLTAVNDIVAIGGAFTSGDIYVINGGTLKVNSGASITTSALRLGGDFGNTGNQNQALGGTLQFTVLTGGQSFGSIINSVSGNTSNALLIDSLSTSGTNTISGNIFLDSALRVNQASGGTLSITNSTLDLKAQTLTLTGTGGSIGITGAIGNSTGSGQLVVGVNGTAGGPTATLSNANTYSGDTFVRAGTLAFTSAGSVANSAIRVGSTSGTSVDANLNLTTLTGGTTISSVINPVTTSGSGTITLNSQNTSGTNTLSGHVALDRSFTITLSAGTGMLTVSSTHTAADTTNILGTDIKGLTLTVAPGAGSTINYTGNIYNSTGAGSVVMNGAGTLVLTGGGASTTGNTFTGGLTINSGTVSATTLASALGGATGTGTVTLGAASGSANASLLIDGRTFANLITVASGTTGNTLSIGQSTAGSAVLSGAITLNHALSLNGGTGNGTLNVTGLITGSSNITTDSNGAGYVQLAATNQNASFTGNVLVNTGTLRVFSASNLGSSNTVSLNAGTTFNLNDNNETVAGLSDGNTTGGTVTNTSGTARTLTLGGSGTYSYGGTITATTPANLALTKSGSGTQTLSGANTYAGGTIINAGTVLIGVSNVGTASGALGVSTVAVNLGSTAAGTSNASLLTNGAFTLSNDITVRSGNSGTATIGGTTADSSTFSGAISLNKNVTLTAVNGGTANFTKSVSNASGTNTVNVTGAGTGTVVFNSATANAFAPTAISISSGTLLLGAGEQIADTTNLTLNGGTFSMAGLTGATETLGALTLSANSTIDFGSGNSDTLRFSSLNLAGFSLSIKGWTGSYYSASETTDHGPSTQDRLLFSSDAATGNSLGAISFYSDAGNLIGTAKEVSYGSGGAYSFEVVPVPEPATWMAGAALLGLVGYRERRRFRRAATVS